MCCKHDVVQGKLLERSAWFVSVPWGSLFSNSVTKCNWHFTNPFIYIYIYIYTHIDIYIKASREISKFSCSFWQQELQECQKKKSVCSLIWPLQDDMTVTHLTNVVKGISKMFLLPYLYFLPDVFSMSYLYYIHIMWYYYTCILRELQNPHDINVWKRKYFRDTFGKNKQLGT